MRLPLKRQRAPISIAISAPSLCVYSAHKLTAINICFSSIKYQNSSTGPRSTVVRKCYDKQLYDAGVKVGIRNPQNDDSVRESPDSHIKMIKILSVIC
jgi:hypothetical protein